jgi:hypothetical protein
MPRNGSEILLKQGTSPAAKSIRAQLSMFDLLTSPASDNAISSPASADGPMPSVSPDGPMIERSGLDLVPASPSAAPINTPAAKPTSATCGQISIVSPTSAFLQSSLESKLRETVDLDGSLEFVLTWKHQDIPSQPRILRLAPRARHRSANGSGLWPWASPKASDGEKASNLSHARKAAGRLPDSLPGQMRMHWGLTVEDGAPSPEHALWLMGYPPAFLSCAPSETLSSRKSPRRSSQPISTSR